MQKIKKPKYKIGDIIVVNIGMDYQQEEIIAAETIDGKWHYKTEWLDEDGDYMYESYSEASMKIEVTMKLK